MRICAIAMMTLSLSAGAMTGCDNSAKSGTLIGAGSGALLGQAIGGNTKGTLIGAGAGALGGYIIGNEMDKDRAKKEQQTREARANNPTYQQNQHTDQLNAENERLRAEIENERLRQQLEAQRGDE
jgi:uncharacterized protein YcfJ